MLIFYYRQGSTKPPASANAVSEKRSSFVSNDITILSAEEQLVQLKNELRVKESIINALSSKVARLEDDARSNPRPKEGNHIVKRQHPVSSKSFIISDKGTDQGKIGTRGSLLTSNILEALEPENNKTRAQVIAEKFIQVFQSPVDHIDYLQSNGFASDLMEVTHTVCRLLENEPRCLFMQSPVYVFGDIHGNLEDLHFFSDNIWKLGMDLTAGQFLFLGDYVDRGMSSLECVAYLFGLKILFPNKISLLRGNHETRDVNGWEEHYREKSFLYQCKDRFGNELGEEVWEECNCAFDRLPLSAVIDHDIFCIHGGIPRPVCDYDNEIQAILEIPKVASVMPAYSYEEDWMRTVASDCLWSDPAPAAMEPSLPPDGFGDSPRGGGAVMFGTTAIDNFLASNQLSYIIRAHEAHAQGVALSKGARVFTVFSTSKDHRQGCRAMAGCILVDFDKIQVINRSPKYKNKYVHRRTSISVNSLSDKQLEERRKLGLVRWSNADEDYYRMKKEIELEEAAAKDKENCKNQQQKGDDPSVFNFVPF